MSESPRDKLQRIASEREARELREHPDAVEGIVRAPSVAEVVLVFWKAAVATPFVAGATFLAAWFTTRRVLIGRDVFSFAGGLCFVVAVGRLLLWTRPRSMYDVRKRVFEDDLGLWFLCVFTVVELVGAGVLLLK